MTRATKHGLVSRNNAWICLATTAAPVGCFVLDACIQDRCWVVVGSKLALVRTTRMCIQAQRMLPASARLLLERIRRRLGACIYCTSGACWCATALANFCAVHTTGAACRVEVSCFVQTCSTEYQPWHNQMPNKRHCWCQYCLVANSNKCGQLLWCLGRRMGERVSTYGSPGALFPGLSHVHCCCCRSCLPCLHHAVPCLHAACG